jgi:hypothetical protein
MIYFVSQAEARTEQAKRDLAIALGLSEVAVLETDSKFFNKFLFFFNFLGL